jgi:hypothetical protein
MDETIIIVAVILFIGLIVFFGYFFSKKTIILRKLKKSAAQRVANVTDGEFAKIIGKVEYTGTPLTAPLSGRTCAYYHVLVEQRVSSGKSSHWKTIIEEEVAVDFGIRDGDYCARIDGNKVKSYIVDDRKYTSGFMNDASEVLERYLKNHGYESEGFLGINKTIRYREGVLEEGELISVMGKCRWVSAESSEWSDSYGKVLVIGPTEKDAVYLSDDPETVKQLKIEN